MNNELKKIIVASSFLVTTSQWVLGDCPDKWAHCRDGTDVMINYHQEKWYSTKCTPINQGSGESVRQAIASCTNNHHGGLDMDSVPGTSLDVMEKVVEGMEGVGKVVIVAGKIALDAASTYQNLKGASNPAPAGAPAAAPAA